MPSSLVVELFAMAAEYFISPEADINIRVLVVAIPDVEIFALCRVCIVIESKGDEDKEDTNGNKIFSFKNAF